MDPLILVDQLREERDRFFSTLSLVRPESLTTPGLLGEWSGRELVAHLGYWTGYAVEAIHAVESGRGDEFGADRPAVDDVNATVARVARETSLASVRKREAASVEALVERLHRIDPSLLDVRVPHVRWTLADGIRLNGPDHYREHADELVAVLGETARG